MLEQTISVLCCPLKEHKLLPTHLQQGSRFTLHLSSLKKRTLSTVPVLETQKVLATIWSSHAVDTLLSSK